MELSAFTVLSWAANGWKDADRKNIIEQTVIMPARIFPDGNKLSVKDFRLRNPPPRGFGLSKIAGQFTFSVMETVVLSEYEIHMI